MGDPSGFHHPSDLKLLDQVFETLRYFRYSYRTEEALLSIYCSLL